MMRVLVLPGSVFDFGQPSFNILDGDNPAGRFKDDAISTAIEFGQKRSQLVALVLIDHLCQSKRSLQRIRVEALD